MADTNSDPVMALAKCFSKILPCPTLERLEVPFCCGVRDLMAVVTPSAAVSRFLKQIDLQGTDITDATLLQLSLLPRIESINVSHCLLISDSGVEEFFQSAQKNSKNLLIVNLSSCKLLSDHIISSTIAFLLYSPSIEELHLNPPNSFSGNFYSFISSTVDFFDLQNFSFRRRSISSKQQ